MRHLRALRHARRGNDQEHGPQTATLIFGSRGLLCKGIPEQRVSRSSFIKMRLFTKKARTL